MALGAAPKFHPLKRDLYRHAEFTLAVGQTLRLDLKLEVGAAAETVTVTDTPPALNTESGTRGAVITNEEIVDLPLSDRDFSDLALLTGGVIPKGDGDDGSYAVNGGRADNTGFLLDGVNNTQRRNTGAVMTPPIESIQEFKMITSGFSAEFGRYAGGMLTVATKSGTNRLRGSLHEFIRNDVWDATGTFDVGKSTLRRNQFGATITGPVYLPKLYNGRNRTFFTATWEGTARPRLPGSSRRCSTKAALTCSSRATNICLPSSRRNPAVTRTRS